jgi:nitroimidazol reductase NimA-like FMN-containing flavoprotein (pyridoxamine 5'-phosphate oxidase superfamily)
MAARAAHLALIREQKHMTLALAGPYLVTVNYGFDPEGDAFYFHCAPHGRKIDAIKADPRVYGQILDDRGYLDGRCDHSFRTVQFEGTAELIHDSTEKRRALDLMISQLEPDPGPVRQRLLLSDRIAEACVVRVRVSYWSGKQNP